MPKRHTAILIISVTFLAATGGALDARAEALVQFLDKTTAVTVTRMTDPMVFFREQAGLAANVRDYVHVGPVEVNSMGERQYYLWMGVWSTIDRGAAGQDPLRDTYRKVVITANDRPMEFEIYSEDPDALGTSESLYPRPGPGARNVFSRVTVEELRTMHEADYLYVSLGDSDSETDLYRVWKYDAESLANFIAYVQGGTPGT